jgi:hypothetical protein
MDCLIPNSHNRLLDSHRLWHQTADSYFDPDAFRANLNATIEALRNITFALQAEKENIPEFDLWYPKWQDRMRQDIILKWLNEARTTVVHKRDLETRSTAKVIIQTYLDLAKCEIIVPPNLPSELIAFYILTEGIKGLPQYILEKCVAEIERLWVAVDLPDYELLDALAHAYQILHLIVSEAHHLTGCDILSCSKKDGLHYLTTKDLNTSQFKCMDIRDSKRKSIISLSNFETLKLEPKTIVYNPDYGEKAAKRYKLENRINVENTNIFKVAEKLNEIAKRVLVKDRYHRSMYFLHIPEIDLQLITIMPKDQTEKYAFMRKIAEEVERTGADAIIDIHETWITSDIEAVERGVPAGETVNKKEALTVSVFTKEGENRSYITLFTRGIIGNIKLQNTIVQNNDIFTYMNPVLKIWKKNNNR